MTAPFTCCTNTQLSILATECGAPAVWIGTHANGREQAFCDLHKREGWERLGIQVWYRIPVGDCTRKETT